jgi:XRE family transcriptional regulator, regulator of sulfur utilization
MSRAPRRKNGSSKKGDGDAGYSPELGKTIQRLRKAYNLSLGELSEQSGVAKSIISQIERNETNPTLATVWRLSQALDTTIDQVLALEEHSNIIEKSSVSAIPVLTSEDGLCTMAIIGWLNTVDWVQWYDFRAEAGGVLESDPHPKGSVENLSVLVGELEVWVDGDAKKVSQGETLRYRGDLPHRITNIGGEAAHATMVNLVKSSVMT